MTAVIDRAPLRPLVFAAAALIHGALFFIAFNVSTSLQNESEPVASVMKLVDLSVYTPPPKELPREDMQNTVESIAETMIEADEIPEDQIVTAPVYAGEPDYFPQHKISTPPDFDAIDDIIKRDTVYPPIALRSGIEGLVILELYIDSAGLVRRAVILKETPESRGFGEAAVKAFENRRVQPARANGIPVAVRFRRSVPFKISH